MKSRYKILIRALAFSVIFVLSVCSLNTFFQPTWLTLNNYYTMSSFYEEPENRIETLFLGASVGAYGFSPTDLYLDYGICAFNLSTQSQPMIASYYWLLETYRLHPEALKNVVLDVSELRKDASDSTMHTALDGMKFSSVKLKAALDYCDKDYDKTLSYLFPLMTYHSRWSELEITDFDKYSYEKVNSTRGFEFTLMNYMSLKASVDQLTIPVTSLNENAEPREFAEKPLEYFYKLYEFCKEKGITLTLVKTPTGNWSSRWNRSVQLLADELGLTFLDFNFSPLTDELDYVHPYDSREGQHVNYYGAKKLMTYLGCYLTESCDATDVRDNPDYSYLKEQSEKYESLYIKQAELHQLGDIADVLECALSDDNTVFITVMDEASEKLTLTQRESFLSYGLEKLSELSFRQAYIGIVTKDGTVYESTAAEGENLTYETVLGDKTRVKLGSGKLEDENYASCIIDGEEKAKCSRGINIVVYSNKYNRAVYSAVYDTYASSVKDCYSYDFGSLKDDKDAIKKYADNRYFSNMLEYIKLEDTKNKDAEEAYILENNDIFGFIAPYTESEDTAIIISVKDDGATMLSENDKALFSSFGFNELSLLGFRQSYVGIMKNGSVLYEERAENNAPAVYENDGITVKSAGFDAGNISSVIISGKEYSPDKRGINVVIYDSAEEKIIKTASFDTYEKQIRTSVEKADKNN